MVLINAVTTGKLAEVQKLFESDYNGPEFSIDEKVQDGEFNSSTALMLALQLGFEDIAMYLLEKGADFNAENLDEQSVIYIATIHNLVNIVRILIEQYGVDKDTECWAEDTPLIAACQERSLDVADYLLSIKADPTKVVDNASPECLDVLDNAFTIALRHGTLDIVKLFIEKYKLIEDINADPLNEAPYLMLAARYCHFEVVQYLLKQGAHPDIKNSENTHLIHFAAEHGWREIVTMLIEIYQVNVDIVDSITFSSTPLILAAKRGNLDILNYLISKKANIDFFNGEHQNALHHSIANGHIEIVQALLKAGVSINTLTSDNNSPLMIAIKYNRTDISKYLIDNNADVSVKRKFVEPFTNVAAEENAFSIALKKDNLDLVKFFIENGKVDINAIEINNTSYILQAARNKALKAVEYLIEQGVKLDSKDSAGNHLIHYAVKNGWYNMLKRLIETYQVNIDELGQENITPFSLSILNSNKEIIEYLISKGCTINRYVYGSTLAREAAKHGTLITIAKAADELSDATPGQNLISFLNTLELNADNASTFSGDHDKYKASKILQSRLKHNLSTNFKFSSYSQYLEALKEALNKHGLLTNAFIEQEIIGQEKDSDFMGQSVLQEISMDLFEIEAIMRNNIFHIEDIRPYTFMVSTLKYYNNFDEYKMLQTYISNSNGDEKIKGILKSIKQLFVNIVFDESIKEENLNIILGKVHTLFNLVKSPSEPQVFSTELLKSLTQEQDILHSFLFYLIYPKYTVAGNLIEDFFKGTFELLGINTFDLVKHIASSSSDFLDSISNAVLTQESKKIVESIKKDVEFTIDTKYEELNIEFDSKVRKADTLSLDDTTNTPSKKTKFSHDEGETTYCPEAEPFSFEIDVSTLGNNKPMDQ